MMTTNDRNQTSPMPPHSSACAASRGAARRALLRALALGSLLAGPIAPLAIAQPPSRQAPSAPSEAARSKAFPSKPITLIIPFPPGGATDAQFRALAQAASARLKQTIVIVNRPGVGGTLGPAAMARSAAPDGHTLSVIPASMFRLPHLQKSNWDPIEDFSYIIGLTSYSYGVSVRADSQWQTLADLIAAAKSAPGKLSYGVTGAGSSGHIMVERLSKLAGIRMSFVPFKGAAEWQSAVLGGHIDVVGDPGWGTLARAGRLRVLATATPERLVDDVPTLRELGYDVTAISMTGIAGPKGLPPGVVAKLHAVFLAASKDPAFVRALKSENQPFIHMDSATYTKYAADQYAADRESVRKLGLLLQ